MPKINQEEYDILQFLNNTKDWIVRNPDGQLWAVEGEVPRKQPFYEMWKEGDGQDASKVDVSSFLFQFIQWEDEKPYNISDLIEEYESEETEVNKQKLIEKWESAIGAAEFCGRGKEDRLIEYMRNFVDDLNQLDEPEVLSQKWISENVEYAYFDMLDGSGRLSSATAIIKPEKLQNLLVPKQEDIDKQKQDAYTDGFKEGERQTTEYFESITEEPSQEQVQKYLSEHRIEIVDKEPETVASVIDDFYKSLERLIKVLNMEVEEMKE